MRHPYRTFGSVLLCLATASCSAHVSGALTPVASASVRPSATPTLSTTTTSPTATPTPTPTPTRTATPSPTPTSSPTASKPGLATGQHGLSTVAGPHPAFVVHRLAPGEKPPQFVVISFDGAGNHRLFQHYLQLAQQTKARFTFFLSGLYLLPEDLRKTYRPENEPVGSSAIGFADRSKIPARLADLSEAWTEGHDIGTHFNGHFCDSHGIQTWDAAGWRTELNDVFDYLEGWPQRTGLKRPPLPFTAHDIQGDRTPCLMGKRKVMLPVFKSYGFRYDASATGQLNWPHREDGLWSFPLQRIRLAGTHHYVLSMDYNFFANQSAAIDVHGAAATKVEQQTYDSLMAAYHAVDNGNRAPLIVGNHFNDWSDGAYVKSLTDFVTNVCDRPGTQCISFRDLSDWLDAQSPKVLASLQGLGVQPE